MNVKLSFTFRTKTLTVTVYDRDQTQDKNILGQCQIDLMENRRINLSWQTFKLENPYSPGTLQYVRLLSSLIYSSSVLCHCYERPLSCGKQKAKKLF